MVRIVVADVESRDTIAEVPPSVVDAVNAALVEPPTDGLQMTSPKWPVVVLLYTEGDETPFVGHPIGDDTLRLNAVEPWSAMIANDDGVIDGRATQAALGEALFDFIGALPQIRSRRSKEYRPRPGVDMSEFRVEE